MMACVQLRQMSGRLLILKVDRYYQYHLGTYT